MAGSFDTREGRTPEHCYGLPVSLYITASPDTNVTLWTMRNPTTATKNLQLEYIYLTMSSDTAGIVNTTPAVKLCRFSTATPTGGTAITIIPQDSSNATSQVADARYSVTGLTTTSVVFEEEFATLGCPINMAATQTFIRHNIGFKLAPGEGFAIRVHTELQSGISIHGEVIWSER